MFNHKLTVFVLIRTAACLLIFSSVLFIMNSRWMIYAGLYVGAVLSLGRFLGNALLFGKQAKVDLKNKLLRSIPSALPYIFNQILLIALLLLFYRLGQRLFWGLVAGVLLVPFVFIVNTITEVFGITKNNFYAD